MCKSGYYGWKIIGALAITETISWGIIYYAFSVFIIPLEQEYGWTRIQISGAFSISLLVSAGMAIPVGFWLDRYGPRGLMTVGSICAVILFYAYSQVTTLPALYTVWVGLGITMAMTLYEPAFVVAAKWFVKRRGAAVATITLAAGFASTIFLPLSDWLLSTFGRIEAKIYLAMILAVGTIPLHALVLRRHPADLGLHPDGMSQDDPATRNSPGHQGATFREALSQSTFWWVAMAFALSTMSGTAVRVHFIPLLIEKGFSGEAAAWLTGLIGAMQVLGRVIYAPAGDKVSVKKMVGALFIIQGASLLLVLMNVVGNLNLWLFVALFGMSHGALTLARPAMMADLYGSVQYGRISSVTVVTKQLATTIAPFGAGYFYVQAGNNYTWVLWIAISLSLLAAVSVTQFRAPTSTFPLDSARQ
ncbi:MAG: hypothetical protein ETSY1_09860 [Candidatus Entotheonella factor]|uniref:Major facilitator superfamily (MFS) profile domain-containing protein n=1 Tax=Entotheonella factor TaxID=1429438 RepID=W4LSI0_ENTF1|nr:MAG: hypothetical protein ETSY1_09860 [Candidatus Entotheonella factor]